MNQFNRYQNALSNLKRFNDRDFLSGLYGCFQEQLTTLQEIVDKETPMKPYDYDCQIGEKISYFNWDCPKCGYFHLTTILHKYCSNCGQKLDWSEVNDK